MSSPDQTTYTDRDGIQHQVFHDPIKGDYYVKHYETEVIKTNSAGEIVTSTRSKPVRVYIKSSKVGRPKKSLDSAVAAQIMFLSEIMTPTEIATQLGISRHLMMRYLQQIHKVEEISDSSSESS